jgi:nitrate/TMAO reductase-like tetraheme cytochrome c subunit
LKLIVIVVVSVCGGLALAGAYGSAIDYTSSLNFCAHTCHEMQDTVYQEYAHSKHFKNEYGVVVPCAKCHVPQDNWPATFGHKAMATFELYNHFVLGESDPAKFTPRRLELAKKVWAGFAATNARECKACHKYSNMVLDDQRPSIRAQHEDAMKTDENCLDCHKGVTHKKFDEPSAAPAGGGAAGGGFDVQ